jgi:imidazolonepropionase-like amidohydrolase
METRSKRQYGVLAPRAGCLCCAPELGQITHRLMAGISRRGFIAGAVTATGFALSDLARAQSAPVPAKPEKPILFKNMRVFDGASPTLRQGAQVLVEGNKIKAIDTGNAAAPDNAQLIDCGGRTLMPGLIDAHWHAMFASLPLVTLMTADIGYIYLEAGAEAERTLMRGFTTVRDMGGPAFALKRAIDEGIVAGPRIYPSGAMISQTSGHGDFRLRHELPRKEGELTHGEEVGAAAIADGPSQVLRRVREQLMLGASQIKLMGGGGVASPHDPLDSIQFLPEEIRAAVGAAADWHTYVTVHIYTPPGIKRYVEAGVRCIEHGQLADEDAARLVVDRDVWWSLQPFLESLVNDRYLGEGSRQKLKIVWDGTDRAYALAIKHKAKVGWGTDVLFSPGKTGYQSRNLAAMTRWYTPSQILKIATHDNAELLALSGPRNPYAGKLGTIAPGAFADILLVDGDPTADLTLLADPAAKLKIIMKDGRIYKNTLGA